MNNSKRGQYTFRMNNTNHYLHEYILLHFLFLAKGGEGI